MLQLGVYLIPMRKKMLSQEDVSQVRKIVREEIHKELKEPKSSIGKLNIAVANLQVGQKEMEHRIKEDVRENTNRVLTLMDGYMKKTEDFKQEQTIQGAMVKSHDLHIEKTKLAFKNIIS